MDNGRQAEAKLKKISVRDRLIRENSIEINQEHR